jgi:amino acid adenylation domain-containing protein
MVTSEITQAGYGPSETTNICTVRSSVSNLDLINNIGKPFDNTSAFVLDPNSETIMPRGAVGELCFGGYQVFQGYLNQPGLTAAKIINHPTYGRIYRSGDLGLMLADDSLLFTGRLDDQVKIRGQRVELGEISSTVLDQGCVQDCTSLLLRDSRDSDILVTFWVPAKTTVYSFRILQGEAYRADITSIFASLSHRLPSYMVPSYLIPITRLPMTAQGKIDKRVLRRHFDDLKEDNKESTAASGAAPNDDPDMLTAGEVQVAEILAETLRLPIDNIKRSSSFFNLGLDSVSAIKFSARLRKEDLGDFTISAILKNPTIAHLTKLKETRQEGSHRTNGSGTKVQEAIISQEISRIRELFDSRGVAISKITPCTPLQEAMLSSGQSTAESLYCNVMVFSVKGDVQQLQQCWALMAQRHDILRTVFLATNDPSHAYAQVVLENATLDWSDIPWTIAAFELAQEMIADLLQTNKPPVWLAFARTEDLTRLLFCCHHAVYDGIAVQTLLKEVQDAYHQHQLPPPISYDAYLQQMLSQNLTEADRFWTTTFKGFEPTAVSNLTGKARNGLNVTASWHRQLRLPLSKIREACHDTSVTLLSVIHATWAKLLHFYTGESDICFGNVVSGRAIPGHDLERLVAPCFNTLPVRVTFDFGNENAALVQSLHTANIDSFAHQLTPLRRIQSTVLKDGGRLFDTLVILQQPSEPLDGSIWTLEEDRGVMDLPLVCELSQNDAEDRLDLILHYHSTIISEKEAAIIAETFEASLAAIVHHPHTPAQDTIDFPQHIQAESNSEINVPDVEVEFLHSGFEHNATASPDRIALDFLHADGKRTTWSFRTLNDRANSIAHELIALGVKTEDILPVHVPKGPLFYASILGILKAGAAFAPVHPGLPEARKKLMVEDLEAKFILSTEDFAPPATAYKAVLVNVEKLAHATRDNPSVKDLTGSNLAYCIFTSGSTGTPKAVSMEHKAPIQTIECSRSLVPWNTSSRLLQYAATTFDMCYYDCFLAWTLGFTLCAAEQDMMLNDLSKIINVLDVDLLDLTPSVAASLTRSAVPNVKWLYCIGEAMTANIVKVWESACVNSYGPSEAAFCTTMYPVAHDVRPSVIGKPFPSTGFAIFPVHGDRPLPLLSTGELYIGGAQLARGYHGRPELTKEKFVTKSGQRFYRSGDVVRMLSNGNFEFIRRMDDQVKIRGLRVELGEINTALHEAHSDIETVATQILRKNVTAKEQLVAFLVTKRPFDEDRREKIRDCLRQVAIDRLPSYMVPQFFIFVDQIPRSLAGKVDKTALTDMFRLSADAKALPNGTLISASKHHWTTLENRIRDVFAHLSSSAPKDVSPTTTIYQLGLDSISAVQIAAALRKEGHSVGAADVMKCLTCTDLAQFIERGAVQDQPTTVRFDFAAFDTKYRPHALTTCHAVDKDIVAVRPCTPLQRGMVSQMLAREGTLYINYLRLELRQGVDLDRMKAAWQRAMDTQQMLRTGFLHLQDKDHSFGMIEYASGVVTLPWDTPSDKGAANATDIWLEGLQREMASEPHRPLWRIRVVCENHTYSLNLAIFHGLFDAQSLQSIFQEVVSAYHGHRIGPPIDLEPIVDGILQRSTISSKQGKEFWAQLGQQTTPCHFPNLAPLRYNPQSPVVRAHRSSKSLNDIEDACRRSNTTLQAAGLASWLSLIAAYTGETVATCGVVLSGRNFEAAESSVFPCINTVPVVHEISADMKYTLNAITKLMAEVQEHQHVPLRDIQKSSGHSNENLFDTIFAYQKLPTQKDCDSLWNVVDEKATIEYPLSIELEPKGDHLEYRLTFMPHTIPQNQAILILEQLDHFLERAIFPGKISRAFDLSLYSITPAKETELPSKTRLLHDFVELSAKVYPDRIAFEFAKSIQESEFQRERWTYSQLEAEGNRIANLLVANGVQPGDLVAVCFDKCPEASFAMLGVLKAGAAFVAIDPGAPPTRQQFIVHDSKAICVLSMSAQSKWFINDVHVPVLNLDETKTSSFPSTKPTLTKEISSQDRSYCLYTSGTTGTPKGCELTHENAVQALLSFQRLFAGHWDSNSRWLQFASFHFDVSVLEQYWSWSVGICVVSAPRDIIFEDLAESINTLGITHIDLTPSLAQILHPDNVPSLCKGVFITGGESLKQEILDVWGPKGVIYNGYGPTEATIGCTMYPRVPANGKPSNIGPQFDNVGTFVLQPGTDIPVLRGGIGELCVSGKLVGKGYLKREDLTQKSFPYLERFNERVYRTGDLVRILHDGTFDFLGRADDQVKLRGQRLEIGEINSVIRQSNQKISDVATLVLKHPRQQKEQLVAFIVVHAKTTRQPSVLLGEASETLTAKDACHDNLPPYMVPTHFVPLTSMPLNVNNKADAKKLKELYESLSTADLQKLSAGSWGNDTSWCHVELDVRTILIKELDVSEDAIEKETSFFELGMDSISVIGVVRALKQAGLTRATASLVMKHSTIRRLANVLSAENQDTQDRTSVLAAQQAIVAMQHRHRRAIARALALSVADFEGLAPCTPLQQGMIAKSLESENGLYFNTFLFKLSKNIDHNALQEAWKTVHTSTQILRTVFANTEDGHAQVVLRDVCCPWKSIEPYKNEAVDDCISRIHGEWLQRNSNEFRHPFELRLLHTPEKTTLIVHIFHGLYDGISIELIFKAMWDVYNGRKSRNNAPAFLSALPHGPLRIVKGAKTFWQEHLSQDTSHSSAQSLADSNSKPVKVTRTIQDLTALEPTRRKLNVTAQAIAQACWLHVLQEYITAVKTIGIVVSGRSINLGDAERIVGPMFNTIPYRNRPQQSDSWASTIKRVHDFNVAAHPYQHTPLRDIMKWCKVDRTRPLFDSLFVFQVAQADNAWAKTEFWEISDGDVAADYPLAFEVEQYPHGQWHLTLIVQSHAFDQAASIALLGRFEEALHQAISEPSAVVETSLGTDGTTDIRSAEFNGTNKSLKGSENFVWTSDANALRELLAELTSNELQGINGSTSIFELGLDSIDAIRLSSKLKSRGINLPVSGIMRGLTIAKMLPHIKKPTSMEQDESTTSSEFQERKHDLRDYIKRQGFSIRQIEDVLPVTPLQEVMVVEMITSEFTRYFNFDVMQLEKGTDIERLRAAWNQVVKATPILRTSFIEIDEPEIDDLYAQMIHVGPHQFWREVEMDHEPDFAALFDTTRKELATTNSSTPPFHVLFVRSPSHSYLVLAIAHALYDGWSLGLLHADVASAYDRTYKSRPSYQKTLSDILTMPESDASDFWGDYLDGAEPSAFTRLPTMDSETPHAVHRLERESTVSAASLVEFARKCNVSLQTMGQSAYAIVLASYVRSLDVAFGSVLSGRDDETTSQLMFPTMNTVVVRTILHGTHIELLRHVQDDFTSLKQWQHYPLREALERACQHGGLFESLFIYQKSMEKSEDKNSLYKSIAGRSDVEYLVCVEMEVIDDQLLWRCAVKDEVFDEAGAQELLNRLDSVLNEIMQQPDRPVIDFTSQGTSVCGLPPFATNEEDGTTFSVTSNESQMHQQGPPRAETVFAIREALAITANLSNEDVTYDMTIFHIGLDSISAIKVSSLLRQKKIILSVGDMLRAGTVANMARLADARSSQKPQQDEDYTLTINKALEELDHDDIILRANAEGCHIKDIEDVQMLPASAGQVYMLSMWLNTTGSNFYPEFTYRLSGKISFEKLQDAWNSVVAANPILKTYFVATQDVRIPYVQLIRKHEEAESHVTNFTELTNKTSNTVQPWAHLHVTQVEDGWTLKLQIHHALYDGVSLPTLMQRLQAICNDDTVSKPTNILKRFIATSVKSESRRSFWTAYLHGVTQSHLPEPQSSVNTRSEIFIPVLLPTKALEDTARQTGISIQSLFLAAYAKFYANLTKTPQEQDVVLGIYLANRSLPIPGVEAAAIPTVNLLPLRVRTPLQLNSVESAKQIQQDLQQIGELSIATTSLWEIKNWTGVVVDTFVNFLTLPDAGEARSMDEGVKIVPGSEWTGPVSRVKEHEEMFEMGDERVEILRNESMNGAYLVSCSSALGLGEMANIY